MEALLEDSRNRQDVARKYYSGWKYATLVFEKSMRTLWPRLLIVGFGEVEDGAFPSLAIGATQTLLKNCGKMLKNFRSLKRSQF